MLFLIFINFIFNKEKETNCHHQLGTTVYKIYVHVDEPAIGGLATFGTDNTPHERLIIFSGKIFDSINKELQSYGIQIHGDYLDLPTTKTPAVYDRTKCWEGNLLETRTPIFGNGLLAKSPDKKNFKKHIVVFYCPENYNSLLKGKMEFNKCDFLLGFLFGPPMVLAKVIRNELLKAITKNGLGDQGYGGICKTASDCENGKDVVFVSDLKSVRHNSDGKYILKNGKKIEEHDLYDDMYFIRYQEKHEESKSTEEDEENND